MPMQGPQPGQQQGAPPPGGQGGEVQQLFQNFMQMEQSQLAEAAVQLVMRVQELEQQMQGGGGAPPQGGPPPGGAPPPR